MFIVSLLFLTRYLYTKCKEEKEQKEGYEAGRRTRGKEKGDTRKKGKEQGGGGGGGGVNRDIKRSTEGRFVLPSLLPFSQPGRTRRP